MASKVWNFFCRRSPPIRKARVARIGLHHNCGSDDLVLLVSTTLRGRRPAHVAWSMPSPLVDSRMYCVVISGVGNMTVTLPVILAGSERNSINLHTNGCTGIRVEHQTRTFPYRKSIFEYFNSHTQYMYRLTYSYRSTKGNWWTVHCHRFPAISTCLPVKQDAFSRHFQLPSATHDSFFPAVSHCLQQHHTIAKQDGVAQDGTITQRMCGDRNYDHYRTWLILAFAACMEWGVKQTVVNNSEQWCVQREGNTAILTQRTIRGYDYCVER